MSKKIEELQQSIARLEKLLPLAEEFRILRPTLPSKMGMSHQEHRDRWKFLDGALKDAGYEGRPERVARQLQLARKELAAAEKAENDRRRAWRLLDNFFRLKAKPWSDI